MGYGLIIYTNSVTEIPLVIQQVDDEVLTAKNYLLSISGGSSISSSGEAGGITGSRTVGGHEKFSSNWEIWSSSVYALVSALGFIGFHCIHFEPNYPLYVIVFLILNVPLGLRAFRSVCRERPNSQIRRKYSIVYDLIIIRSFLRNHVILIIFVFLVCNCHVLFPSAAVFFDVIIVVHIFFCF